MVGKILVRMPPAGRAFPGRIPSFLRKVPERGAGGESGEEKGVRLRTQNRGVSPRVKGGFANERS